jgi:hypothetical protein
MRPIVVHRVLLASLVSLFAACDREGASTPPAECPACECKCECTNDGVGGASSSSPGAATPTPADARTAELTRSLARKIARQDATCLDDVAQLQRNPSSAQWLELQRALCLMVSGRCAEGGRVVAKQLRDDGNMLEEQVERTVETYQSMHCTGRLDDRLELLRAITTLSKGGYQGNIGAQACSDAIASATRVMGRVRPKDVDDSHVANAPQTVAYTGAACLGRAGDCSAAFRVLRDHLATQPWAASLDPTTRHTTFTTTFESVVPRCKGRAPTR